MRRHKTWFISGLLMLALLSQAWITPAGLWAGDTYGVTLTGEIRYNQQLHAYIVQTEDPSGTWGEYLITNPKTEVLDIYAGIGEKVTVKGNMNQGSSFFLAITNINGQRY